jgi:hypothetical protein
MVRLADLPAYERQHLLQKNLPPSGPPTWKARTKPLVKFRIALITTAGLHFRGLPIEDSEALLDELWDYAALSEKRLATAMAAL